MGADYIFACARVRGNERNLLTREKLNVMIEARSMEDACKVLQEAGYGDGETISPLSYERVLEQETERVYDFINSIAPGSEEMAIFRYPFDYHNLKVLLKAEFLGISPRGILMTGGTIAPDVMTMLVKERGYTAMTPHMRVAIEECVDTHARTKDPQCIDLICDRECYADICEVAEKSGNRFVRGYVALLIDTINLKTFVRAKKMNQPWSFFGNVYLPGGDIGEKVFVAGYDEPFHQFAARLTPYALAGAAEGGGAGLKENGSFTSLEKLCDDALMRYIRDAKYISFGVEPLIAYVVAKQMEIKSVRIILMGRKAGIDGSLLRERVRETYG